MLLPRAACALGLSAWVGLGAVAASAAAPPTDVAPAPPLVIIVTPPGSPATVTAARQAVIETARTEGSAVLDLSPAPPSPPTGAARLRRAVEAFEAFRYDDALAELDAALAEAAATGGAGLAATELSDLLLYRAMVLAERGDATRAWDDFVAAAVLDPTRLLDPLRFPPRTVEAFGRAVVAVRAGARGRLAIDAPRGCEAIVDGRPLDAKAGRATLELALGTHYVRVACPGFEPWGTRAWLSGEGLELRPRLARPSIPGETELLDAARTAGADTALFVVARVAPGAAPTLELQLVDPRRGGPRRRALVVLEPGRGANDAAAATRRLLRTRAAVQTLQPAPRAMAPWYRRPWLWGLAGAAVAAAVLLPFTLDREPPSGFDLRPSGETPP